MNNSAAYQEAQIKLRGAHLLLVEDHEINRQLAIELLASNGITVEVANNGQEALDLLNDSGVFDGVLMDVQTRELERMVELRTAELAKTRLQIIRRLGCASEFRDNETGNHVIRMSHYSRLIAQAAGMGEESVDILFNAAPLHEVGKIGVPDSVLLHPGKLDQARWEVIRRHPVIGAKIIGNHQDVLFQTAHTVALMHHEKWDGSGYPNKLKGEEIQLVARIIAIADVFDALTSDRPYKKAWPIEDTVRLIEESAGSHFDPGLIKAFQTVLPEILHIKEKYAEEQGAMIDKEW